MTARRSDIADLPNWPRGLSLEQASAYVGISPSHFTRHVTVTPIGVGGRIIYDRQDLDRWLDLRGNRTQPFNFAGDWLGKLDAPKA